nr:hypothetical protein [uncultured Rhodoferax sp.]
METDFATGLATCLDATLAKGLAVGLAGTAFTWVLETAFATGLVAALAVGLVATGLVATGFSAATTFSTSVMYFPSE